MGPDFDCDYRGQGRDHQVRGPRTATGNASRSLEKGEIYDALLDSVAQSLKKTMAMVCEANKASELSGLLACEQEPATIRLLDSLRGYLLAGASSSLTGASFARLPISSLAATSDSISSS